MARRTKTAFLSWTPKGGKTRTLFFDVLITEATETSAIITEHPVEVGPDVSDNVRPSLTSLTLEVLVSNHPIIDTNNRGAAMNLVHLDVPPPPPPPGALFGQIQSAITSLLDKKIPSSATVFQFSNAFNAVKETQDILDLLRTSAQLIDVYTTTAFYRNMVLRSVRLTKDSTTGTSGRFSLEFAQIQLVELKLVQAPTPTEIRATPAVKKGGQAPEVPEAQKESVLSKSKTKVKQLLGLGL